VPRGHYATWVQPCQPTRERVGASSSIAMTTSLGGRVRTASRAVSWAGLGLLDYFLVVAAVITLAPFRFGWPRGPRVS